MRRAWIEHGLGRLPRPAGDARKHRNQLEDGAVWEDPLFCAPSSCEDAPTTEVLDLPSASHVRVRAIDVRGAVVARVFDGVLPPGSHPIEWPPSGHGDGRAIASGVYWLKVETEGWESVRAITVVR